MKHYLTDERIKEMQWFCETDTNFEDDGVIFWLLINYGKGNHRITVGDTIIGKEKWSVYNIIYSLRMFSPDIIEVNGYEEIYGDEIGWIDFELKI